MRAYSIVCVLIASGASALAFVACASNALPPLDVNGNEPPERVTGFDAGPGDAATEGSTCIGATDGGCNDLALCGMRVYAVGVASPLPAAAGGTIVPGTYVLTGFQGFTGSPILVGTSTSVWFNQTFLLGSSAATDGGASLVVPFSEATASNDTPSIANLSGTFSLAATSIGIDFSCGAPAGTTTLGYTSTPTSLVLYTPQDIAYTFTLE